MHTRFTPSALVAITAMQGRKKDAPVVTFSVTAPKVGEKLADGKGTMSVLMTQQPL